MSPEIKAFRERIGGKVLFDMTRAELREYIYLTGTTESLEPDIVLLLGFLIGVVPENYEPK